MLRFPLRVPPTLSALMLKNSHNAPTNICTLVIVWDGSGCLACQEKKHQIPCNWRQMALKAKGTSQLRVFARVCVFFHFLLRVRDELLTVKWEEEKLSQCYSRNNTSLQQQKQDGGRCADSCLPSVPLGRDGQEQPVQVTEPAGPEPNAGRTFSLAAFITRKCAEDVGFAGWPHGSTPLTSPFCPGLHISDLSASSCQVLWRLSLFFFNVNFLPLSSLLVYFYFLAIHFVPLPLCFSYLSLLVLFIVRF